MEAEELEGMLIDYIDGTCNDADKATITKLLAEREDVRALYQQLKDVLQAMDNVTPVNPSFELQSNFNKLLKKEISKRETPTIFFHTTFFRIAASVALLIIGGGIVFWMNAYHQQQMAIESMRKEMEASKHAMIVMLHNQQSASQRLQAANVAYKMENADDEIVNALVKTMNEDTNTNVRLAALDALSKFHQQQHVRKALIASLSRQHDPVVQIALIRLMVDMKEKDVVNELQRITNDEEALPAVKDEAHAGILRLS